jgi:ferrochelatase
MSERLAVVLFNLGGPDGPQSIKPFLFNLFNDPAILPLPSLLRWTLAKLIARRRAGAAREIYAVLGGRSPLLELTRYQAAALEERLCGDDCETRVFIAMRYWHPLSEETAGEVKAFAPDRIVLLPLYPHFSTTTTGSSVREWQRAAVKIGLSAGITTVCCYPVNLGLIAAHTRLVRDGLETAKAATPAPVRVLFSAHGLPKRVIERGDPYQWQVESTVSAVACELSLRPEEYALCYQSRVGPLEWIGPAIDEELQRAARDGCAVVVVPIAFVSEHSETLVELDIEYRKRAEQLGIPAFIRVPALGTLPEFIDGLAELVKEARATSTDVVAGGGRRLCPRSLQGCPCSFSSNLV